MTSQDKSSKSVKHAATDVTRRMICGGLAGMIAKTATNPLERLKLLSQTGEHGLPTGNTALDIVALFRRIVHNEGWQGLWAGNGANLLRIFPAKAIVFSCNDIYRKYLTQNAPPHVPVSFLAGGLAGVTASAVTYPLDLIRGRISGKLAENKHSKVYKGIWPTFRRTVTDEGFLALYKGITPTLLGAMPYEGIKFGTVGVLEKYLPLTDDDTTTTKSLRKLVFGGLGGVMAGVITYPNDTIRRLLQLQGSHGTTSKYNGYFDCLMQTFRTGGLSRLYRGLTINLIRMAPNAAIQFGSYELLKNWTAEYFVN